MPHPHTVRRNAMPRVTWQQLYDAFAAMQPRDHTLARMGFAQAMTHRAWRTVITTRAVQHSRASSTHHRTAQP